MSELIHLAIAGSTDYAQKCAAALAQHPNFKIRWVLTPKPKPVGRQQKKIANPVHKWARKKSLKVFLTANKIDQALKQEILQYTAFLDKSRQIDYLLVVDFGYFIPQWLRKLPQKTALNLHPSALPSWRGSSPAQFAILANDNQGAISLIELTAQLDAGPIIKQKKFPIKPDWTSQDYYQHSFQLAHNLLPDWILAFHNQELTPTPQPKKSPTIEAGEIQKEDAFIAWKILTNLMKNKQQNLLKLKKDLKTDRLLSQFLNQLDPTQWPQLIERASRALRPWPILWTKIPTKKGRRRMQILSCRVEENGALHLNKVKIAGQKTALWNQVKNIVENNAAA